MVERLKQVIEYYGLNTRQFEQKIFASSGQIYTLLSRGGGLNLTTICKILENCNEISPDWLLLGKGEMLRSEGDGNSQATPEKEIILKDLIDKKDHRIEEMTRENEHLRLENEALKSPSNGAGIFVQHDGGNNTYNNNTDLMQLVTSQQAEIRELTEQNKKLTDIIANKL